MCTFKTVFAISPTLPFKVSFCILDVLRAPKKRHRNWHLYFSKNLQVSFHPKLEKFHVSATKLPSQENIFWEWKKKFYFNKIEKSCLNNGLSKLDNTITQHIFSESIILKGNSSPSFTYMTELHQCQHFTMKALNLLKQIFFVWKLSVRRLPTTSALKSLCPSCHHKALLSKAPCEEQSGDYSHDY